MKQSENISLVGLMGAGTTTVGRLLARALQLPFYDSDKAIEERTGVDISTQRFLSLKAKQVSAIVNKK